MNTLSTPCAARPSAVGRDPAAALAALSLPLLFILLWSSGYVAGRLGLPNAGPLSLLSLRFGLSFAVLLALSLIGRARWPQRARDWGHLAVVGLLMQGLHFGALYEGLARGLSAGLAGLLIGLMPVATALGARLWLGEALGRRAALGLAGGLLGVALVLAERPLAAQDWAAPAWGLLALAGLVSGTLYQKRFCAGMDLRSGSCVQMGTAALAVAPLALWGEGWRVDWGLELGGALLWLGLVNSIGAFSLMFVMMRRGQASQVARLFYLIPGVSALLGALLLGERLGALAIAGFVLSALAVALAARGR